MKYLIIFGTNADDDTGDDGNGGEHVIKKSIKG